MTTIASDGMARRPLIEVATVLRGTVPAHASAESEGPAFFGIAEITAKGRGPVRRVSADGVDRSTSALDRGDIAIALLGDVGESALVRESHEGALLGRECAALRPRLERVTSGWLYVWTQSRDFKDQVEAGTSGSTMPRLSVRLLSEFTLPLPSSIAQQRVEQELVQFEEAISITEAMLTYLRELWQVEVELAFARLGDPDGATA